MRNFVDQKPSLLIFCVKYIVTWWFWRPRIKEFMKIYPWLYADSLTLNIILNNNFVIIHKKISTLSKQIIITIFSLKKNWKITSPESSILHLLLLLYNVNRYFKVPIDLEMIPPLFWRPKSSLTPSYKNIFSVDLYRCGYMFVNVCMWVFVNMCVWVCVLLYFSYPVFDVVFFTLHSPYTYLLHSVIRVRNTQPI